jgi:TolB-like protein/Tfp pilus assembly protein PilF
VKRFFGELKRRNVVKVGAAYAVVAWLVIQAADIVFPALQLPEWTVTFVTVLLLLGFPIALVLAWAYELGPQGVLPDPGSGAAEEAAGGSSHVGFYLLVGGVALAALVLVGMNRFASAPREPQKDLDRWIAVLPFESLSPDPEHAYFAAGVHEELLNELAKIPELSVIARTSVMQYAGVAAPVASIAEELGVGTIMEGTVRYADNRVRVTAQLVDAESGAHLWSDAYERELSDIFDIQSDIATSVAEVLKIGLSDAADRGLFNAQTRSGEAYLHFLKAIDSAESARRTALVQTRGAVRPDPHRELDAAIALDPNFALAYAEKAWLYAGSLLSGADFRGAAIVPREVEVRVMSNAEMALSLVADLDKAHAALGRLALYHKNVDAAREALERALAASPNDVDLLAELVRLEAYAGSGREALTVVSRALTLDPGNASLHLTRGRVLLLEGDRDRAIESLRRAVSLRPASLEGRLALAETEFVSGDLDDAREVLRSVALLLDAAGAPQELATAAFVHAGLGDTERASVLVRRVESADRHSAGSRALAYLAVGDYEALYEVLVAAAEESTLDPDHLQLMLIGAGVYADPTLEQPRFSSVLGELRLD